MALNCLSSRLSRPILIIREIAPLLAASGDTSPHWTKQRFNLLKPQTRENRPALDEVVLCVNLDKDKCRFFIPRYW
jgi:hypothetical protein